MADQTIYAQSVENVSISSPLINKQVNYFIDLNNSNYQSGQIILDSSSISNSGRWADYQNSYWELPLVIGLYPTTSPPASFAGTDFAFSAGLKSGSWQLIDSMSVEVNGVNTIQLTRYSNFYLHYRMLTSMSQDDLHKLGPSLLFSPDSSDSWTFETAASVNGIGSTNNKVFGWDAIYPNKEGYLYSSAIVGAGASPVSISAIGAGTPFDSLYTTNYPSVADQIPEIANKGLYQRCKMTAINTSSSKYTSLLSEANIGTLWMNYFKNETNCKLWFITCQIRLKDVSDFFANLPLTRGLYIRAIVNVNLGTATLTSSSQAAVAGTTGSYGTPLCTKYTMTTNPILTNFTYPVLFSSAAPCQPNAALDTVGGNTFKLQTSIYQLTTSGKYGGDTTYSHKLTSVRWYVPTYVMSAAAEAAYLESNPTKTIVYKDILQYLIPATETQGTVNQLLSNGVVGAQGLLLVPIFAAGANGNGSGVVAPHQSPFATEPATTSPLCAVTQFNVLLAGQSIYQLTQQYSFQQFTDEIQHCNAINGGITVGLNSGLLSEEMWQQNYRYVYVDLSRRVAADSVVPKSVQVLFQNLSTKSVQYICFIEVERAITIQTSNGAIVA